jgi:hypothetical protein
LEKNSGQFCNNSVHGWWWWFCCVGFIVLLVERWAEPGCGSSCTGLLPAAARDCWILRRMIWSGVIWCDEVDDGPLQEPQYYSYTDPNMVGWVISHIWCSYSTPRHEFPRSGVYSFHLFLCVFWTCICLQSHPLIICWVWDLMTAAMTKCSQIKL